jgi:hypothetical protein
LFGNPSKQVGSTAVCRSRERPASDPDRHHHDRLVFRCVGATYPGVAQENTVLQTVYQIQFALGDPGFSVPFVLLIAGVSVTAGFRRLPPKWLVVFGLVIAAAGELSWIEILVPKALFLIPLTRFLGFVWVIAAGFTMPDAI